MAHGLVRYTQGFNMVFSIGKQKITGFCTRFFLAKIQAELEGFYGCFVPLMQFETPIAFFWG